MSRIGNRPIDIPSGVNVDVSGGQLRVKGPKGELAAPIPEGIKASVVDGSLAFERPDDSKPARARHGLARALANNMVVGVSEGFVRRLEIEGVGYRADVQGNTLNLLLGFSHPVKMAIPDGLKVSVEANTKVSIEGTNREVVGQFAADVRRLRPPEPYKGKGVRYSDERIRRKVGKAGS
ncbi:MAG: 50S ribosomal protein L6 [Spirochaetaceae bacterium]|nr:50S ribosomal protein L6 [Myxococcales bacterium]MCB9723735.1 50S ribosomal protein L6 [Spirochaetaceae bacterium]HPG26744.1 50S ribosomal protein L6 [Myxococcota bacterium]